MGRLESESQLGVLRVGFPKWFPTLLPRSFEKEMSLDIPLQGAHRPTFLPDEEPSRAQCPGDVSAAGPRCVSPALLMAVLYLVVHTEARVDCRKFVFAPMCRGVAAKRAQPLGAHGPYFLDTGRRLSSLETVLGLYATSAPPEATEEQSRDFDPRGQEQAWNPLAEQGPKTDVLYDWYINTSEKKQGTRSL
uniref:(California timema) hypothetical protein n=1 Tax=Timema californicum TaxID=61474 RepID=A0A7R9J516_TIMCA|nr:unnamed protein product [Timema californicum]